MTNIMYLGAEVKAGMLISCIMFSTLVFLILSMTVQATEFMQKNNSSVKADDILAHITQHDDVNLTDCRIVGKLDYELCKEFNVVERNITIKDSTFEDNVYFSHAQFKNSVSFENTTFNNSADFRYATFNNFAGFVHTTFNNYANFNKVTFNNSAGFVDATFNDAVNFDFAQFKNFAYFRSAKFNNPASFNGMSVSDVNFEGAEFNNPAYFWFAEFNNPAYFQDAIFNDAVYFNFAEFNNPAYFSNATFNDTAKFIGPKTAEKVVPDGANLHIFTRYYNDIGRYDYVDDVVYNYRYTNMLHERDIFPFLTDFLSWLTSGFGMKPFNTICFGIFLIIIFMIIYSNPGALERKKNNSRVPFRLSLKNPGIVNELDHDQKATVFDLIYYSIGAFVLIGHENWYAKDNFRKWVSLEGVLGYIVLAILVVTLSHVMRTSS